MIKKSPQQLFQQNLALRYLAVAAAFLAIILLTFSTFQVYRSYREDVRDLNTAAGIQSEFLAAVSVEHLLTNNFYVLERLVRQTHQNPDVVYAVILDNNGRALTRWFDAENPIIVEARDSSSPNDLLELIERVRQNELVRERRQAIQLEELQQGQVWLGYSLASVRQNLITSAQTTLLTTLATIVLLAGLTFVVFHLLIGRRLQQVGLMAEEFAAGDYHRRAKVVIPDEIGRLALAFNHMADRLQETLQGLHHANEHAEAVNKALRASEGEARQLSHVASRTSNLVIISDAEGNIQWVNEGFERVTGYALDEVIGRRPGELLQGPLTDPAIVNYMRRRLKQQEPFNCELINYTRDGDPYWIAVDVAPVYDDTGQVINYVAVEADITERKQAEEAMRQRIKLDTLISEVSAEFISCHADDIDAKILEMIEHLAHELDIDYAAVQLFQGNKNTELKLQSIWIVDDLAANATMSRVISCDHASWWSRTLADGDPIVASSVQSLPGYPTEISTLLDNARFRSILVLPMAWDGQHQGQFILGTIFRERGWSDEAVTAVALVADIFASALQRKQMDMALEAERASLERRTADLHTANAALAEASRAKDTFWTNMSHELRTPLNVILGYTQLMERDPALTEVQTTHLSVIEKSGNHLLALINDVLSLSKIEAGRMTLTTGPFDLHEMLTNLARMFRPRMAKKRLTFTVENAHDLPRFVASDEGKIRQVLLNLLDNALKFTKTGSVSLSALYQRSHGLIYFTVSDTGIGIKAHEIDQLFQHFTQTESGRQSKSGTGLGLALSQQFAHLMGGDIVVESRPTGGTTFTFHVEVELVSELAVETANDRGRIVGFAPQPQALRVLIAEDMEDNQHFMTQVLEQSSFACRVATNGREAVDIATRWEPHIILMDLRMPEMDGYDATRLIRQAPSCASTPIIAVTASALDTQRDRALAAGCTDVLYKPVQIDALFRIMARYLDLELKYAPAEEDGDLLLNSVADPASEEMFDILPERLRMDLHHAAMMLDTEKLRLLCRNVSHVDADVARQLTALIDEFDLESIIELTGEHNI